jgi:hypothetical protein
VSEQYATHLFSYRFGDARWALEIKASSADEARERLKALAWATYDGELHTSVKIAPRRTLRLFEWIRGIAAPNQ